MADDKARDALIDHELSHIIWNGDLDDETNRAAVIVKGHEIEEFAQVLERRKVHPAQPTAWFSPSSHCGKGQHVSQPRTPSDDAQRR